MVVACYRRLRRNLASDANSFSNGANFRGSTGQQHNFPYLLQRAIVGELHIDIEITLPQDSHDLLQRVAVLA